MNDSAIVSIIATWGITNSFLIVMYMNKNKVYCNNMSAVILCTFATALSVYDIYKSGKN